MMEYLRNPFTAGLRLADYADIVCSPEKWWSWDVVFDLGIHISYSKCYAKIQVYLISVPNTIKSFARFSYDYWVTVKGHALRGHMEILYAEVVWVSIAWWPMQ